MIAKATTLLKKTQTKSGFKSLAELPTPSVTMIASPASAGKRIVSVQLARAYAHHRLHQYAEAVDDYTACSASAPTQAAVYYNRACSLYRLGRLQEAASDLTKAMKLDTKNLLYIESRARVLKEMGRFQDAIRDYSWLNSLRLAPAPSQHLPIGSNVGLEAPGVELGTNHSLSLTMAELDAVLSTPIESTTRPNAQGNRRERAKDWLWEFLNRDQSARTASDVLDAVQRVSNWSFFSAMDSDMIQKCMEEATCERFEAERTLVKQGLISKCFHVLLDGTAPLVRTVSSSGSTAKYSELKTFYQGDAIGCEPPGATSTDGRLLTLRTRPPGDQVVEDSSAGHQALPRMKPFRSLAVVAATAVPARRSSTSLVKPEFLQAEPATFSSLGDVYCLTLDGGAYYRILHAHEQVHLDTRLQFLRGCKGFENLPEDKLGDLAAVSGAKIYDPGTDVLRAGEIVKQLWLVKRGVCQVRKAITLGVKSVSRARRSSGGRFQGGEDPLTARSMDGSWVLDNGWMLTNPRLVNGAQQRNSDQRTTTEDVTVAILASGQLFGELSVLQPGQPSPVTVRSQTMIETLVFLAEDLAQLHVQYHSGTMNALQDSLLFHNPPQQKIAQLHREHERWSREKAGVLSELFANQSPIKSPSPLRASWTAKGRCKSKQAARYKPEAEPNSHGEEQ